VPTWTRRAKQSVRRAGGVIGSVVAVRTASPIAVLTYDDGPEPGGTDRVLEVLADRGARATFFVLLSRVNLYPSLLDEIVAGGHEVALHGVDHRRLTSQSSRDVIDQLRTGRAALEDRCGQRVRWMRPPYGAQTVTTSLAIRRAGLTPVLWGPSSWDWKPTTDEARLSRIREQTSKGSILLCHDGFADSRDGARDGSPPDVNRHELAVRILDVFDELQLGACSLSAAFSTGSAVREARFTR
jgi:peptidoglycan/xylan/chitin deacetylase (PgdA/CDA1 family)